MSHPTDLNKLLHIFRQEGWRFEQENLSDKDSSITFKGVVFNEMKGVFVNKLLHPSTFLGYNYYTHITSSVIVLF